MDNLYKKAERIARTAHEGQFDKAGVPYINHPLTVAAIVKNNGGSVNAQIVALLHDVVEDTSWTISQLTNEGFDKEVIEALRLLTHDKSVPYFDYLVPIKNNPLAREVKIADLTHNSDESRLSKLTTKDIERIQKYKKALQYLLN